MSKNDKYIVEAIDNFRSDREITRDLLDDAIKYFANDESRHRDIGLTLAKYVETLQRSNEQLVKVVNLMNKNTKAGLTSEDKEEIYGMISGDNPDDDTA